MARKKTSRPTDPAGAGPVPALQRACRGGDRVALLAWADALQEAGDAEGADVLRDVPGLADALRAGLDAWAAAPTGERSVWWRTTPTGGAWWCGDSPQTGATGADAPTVALIRRLLDRWADLHPAVEWLARAFDLPRVGTNSSPDGTDALGFASNIYHLNLPRWPVGLPPAGYRVFAVSFREPFEPDGE